MLMLINLARSIMSFICIERMHVCQEKYDNDFHLNMNDAMLHQWMHTRWSLMERYDGGQECVKSIQQMWKEPDQFETKREYSKLDLQKPQWLKHAYIRMHCGKSHNFLTLEETHLRLLACFLQQKKQETQGKKSPFILISLLLKWILVTMDVWLENSQLNIIIYNVCISFTINCIFRKLMSYYHSWCLEELVKWGQNLSEHNVMRSCHASVKCWGFYSSNSTKSNSKNRSLSCNQSARGGQRE